MGNSNSSSANPRFTSASRAFTQKKLEDLKSLFASLASKSQSNHQYVSYPAFQEYFGLSGSLGERIFDMVTQHRKDDKLTFEDLVIAKATYEKGTDDEIAEFIYQTLDVTGNGVLARSDLESVLVVILKSVFSAESSDAESSDYKEMVDALLNAATFSKSDDDDGSEKGMTFADFRSWSSHVPTIRKFLGSLLMPPGPVRPGYQVPNLLSGDGVDSDRLLLKKEYAWHIGGALPHHELVEWKLLYHSSLHGQSFNTFLGHTSNTGMSASVLIIKDKEGCVYGGYASQPWERYSDFYGDMKSFLFQLNPKAAIYRPTGANTNIQWCATNFTSENIPNGIGFGGKINHYGLFISASFDQGQTFECTTFGSPSLSKTSRIQPEVIECWGIVQASNEIDTKHNAMKGTVLERFKEDRNMLKLVGMAGNSND
ncbi:PREDICTED: TLD domain-containing protein 1 [Camelina sativa]|uniref:TLD domain-containing protein 1 n=1 Tax=Camelina sativa TaxID=90675 RepID=A0ABM0XUF2_CAMSA|nr:PREDICTED: TLD domain-containing protein 1 [Camelina sativa]